MDKPSTFQPEVSAINSFISLFYSLFRNFSPGDLLLGLAGGAVLLGLQIGFSLEFGIFLGVLALILGLAYFHSLKSSHIYFFSEEWVGSNYFFKRSFLEFPVQFTGTLGRPLMREKRFFSQAEGILYQNSKGHIRVRCRINQEELSGLGSHPWLLEFSIEEIKRIQCGLDVRLGETLPCILIELKGEKKPLVFHLVNSQLRDELSQFLNQKTKKLAKIA